jgi:hypothetical protein
MQRAGTNRLDGVPRAIRLMVGASQSSHGSQMSATASAIVPAKDGGSFLTEAVGALACLGEALLLCRVRAIARARSPARPACAI